MSLLPWAVFVWALSSSTSFPQAGMGESKAMEVPQVRDALWFDPARLLLSFLTGFVVARWTLDLLVPGGCLSWV